MTHDDSGRPDEPTSAHPRPPDSERQTGYIPAPAPGEHPTAWTARPDDAATSWVPAPGGPAYGPGGYPPNARGGPGYGAVGTGAAAGGAAFAAGAAAGYGAGGAAGGAAAGGAAAGGAAGSAAAGFGAGGAAGAGATHLAGGVSGFGATALSHSAGGAVAGGQAGVGAVAGGQAGVGAVTGGKAGIGAVVTSKTGIAVGGGFVATAVAVTTAVVVMSGGDSGPKWTYDLSTAPSQAWQLEPADYGAMSWGNPATYYGARGDTGYLVDVDEGIVIVSARNAPSDTGVTGINADTGALAWRSGPPAGEATYGNGCSPVLPDHRIACGTSTIAFIDTRTGERIATVQAPTGYDSMVPVGPTLAYLSSNSTLTVEGGTDSGPGEWTINGPTATGNTIWNSNDTVGAYCSASATSGTGSVVFDAAGEQILPASTAACYQAIEDGGILKTTGVSGSVLYSDSGAELYRASGLLTPLPSENADTRIGIDHAAGSGIDMDNGKLLWSAPQLRSEYVSNAVMVVGNIVIAKTDGAGTSLSGFSTTNGDEVWSEYFSPRASISSPVSDGRHIAFLSGDQILCYDTTDGSQVWSLPFPADDYPELTLVGGKLVVVGIRSVTGFGW